MIKIYNSFDLSEANRRKLSEIVKEFDNFAIGETNDTYERYVFNSRDQKEGESIDAYVGELRILVQSCNFCTCLHDTSPLYAIGLFLAYMMEARASVCCAGAS